MRDLITLEWNAKGHVVAAHEKHIAPLPSPSPAAKQPPLAKPQPPTRYSFEDRAVEGKPWDLQRLGEARHGLQYAPPEVMPNFLAVLLDCLV